MPALNIEQTLQDLKNDFIDGLGERTHLIEELILSNTPDDEAELFRLVHSLKGTSGTYGILIITRICHQIEDLIGFRQAGKLDDKHFQEQSLSLVDLIREAAREARSGNNDFNHIMIKLDTIQTIGSTGDKLNILLVEPSESSRKILNQVLSREDINIISKKDGFSALTTALTYRIDCLITSYETPGLNGMALIAAVKQQKKINTPVTALISSKPPETFDHIPDFVIKRDNQFSHAIHDLLVHISRQDRKLTG